MATRNQVLSVILLNPDGSTKSQTTSVVIDTAFYAYTSSIPIKAEVARQMSLQFAPGVWISAIVPTPNNWGSPLVTNPVMQGVSTLVVPDDLAGGATLPTTVTKVNETLEFLRDLLAALNASA